MHRSIFGIFLLPALSDCRRLEEGRCGNTDDRTSLLHPNRKWKDSHLTYQIANYPSSLNGSIVRKVMKESLEKWGLITNRTFEEKNFGVSDIVVSFVGKDHGDEKAFDGPGGVLAHAYFPDTTLKGRVHFDSDEVWTFRNDTGTDLESVSLHEFGHTMGLSHNDNPDSVMYPWFQGYTELHDQDANAARILYEIPEYGKMQPGICTTDFDAAAIIGRKFYFFKDEWFAVYDGLRPKSTRFFKIRDYWHALPDDLDRVDALYERVSTDSNVIVFNGQNYWILKNNREATDCPARGCNISNFGIPNTVERIDAAFQWRGDTFLISNDNYWRYDEKKRTLASGYPRPIFSLFSIPPPSPLDAVLTLRNGSVVVLKRTKFYHYNNPTRSVPYDSRHEWFYCEDELVNRNKAQSLLSFRKFHIFWWSLLIFVLLWSA